MNIFEDKTAMPVDAPKRDPMAGIVSPKSDRADVVSTAQTLRDFRNDNWGYGADAMDVKSVSRPRYGHNT